MKPVQPCNPPPCPLPVTPPQVTQGVREAQQLQRNPLTQAKFSLYSTLGHFYLAFMFLTLMSIVGMECWMFAGSGLPTRWADRILFLVQFLGIFAMGTSMLLLYRKHRRIYRLCHNLCTRCGYDLRASPDRCPECGKAVEGKPTR